MVKHIHLSQTKADENNANDIVAEGTESGGHIIDENCTCGSTS